MDVYDRIALLLKMPTITQSLCPHCGEWAIRLHNRDGSAEEV
jgi:hypothetical protein